MNTQTKKILQIILSVVMIISVFLTWYTYGTSENIGINSGGLNYSSKGNDFQSISGISVVSMGPGLIILIVSIASIVLIFTKYRFVNSILGMINLIIVIFVLLTFRNQITSLTGEGGVSLSSNEGGGNFDVKFEITTGFGLYLLLIGSILFSILSYDKKLLSFFSEKLSSNTVSNTITKISSTTENKSEVKYCPSCGKPSPVQSSFCANCGNSF